MSNPVPSPPSQEVLRLVEADQRQAIEFISRMINIETATRAVILPLASALAGLAVTNDSWALAVAGVPVVIMGLLMEVRSGYLRHIGHRRAVNLERIMQSYVTYLREVGRPLATKTATKLEVDIDSYEVGMSRSLRNMRWGPGLKLAFGGIAAWLYVGVLIALLAAAGVGLSNHSPAIASGTMCIQGPSGALLRISGSEISVRGDVTLVECPIVANSR